MLERQSYLGVLRGIMFHRDVTMRSSSGYFLLGFHLHPYYCYSQEVRRLGFTQFQDQSQYSTKKGTIQKGLPEPRDEFCIVVDLTLPIRRVSATCERFCAIEYASAL